MSKRMRWQRKRSRLTSRAYKAVKRAVFDCLKLVCIKEVDRIYNQRHDCEDEDQDYHDNTCGQCGGDGYIMLSEAGPGAWGEDCFCSEDEPIECPECRGDGVCV